MEEKFVLSVYGDVCLISGCEKGKSYTYKDIEICTKRNIIEMIEEYYN